MGSYKVTIDQVIDGYTTSEESKSRKGREESFELGASQLISEILEQQGKSRKAA